MDTDNLTGLLSPEGESAVSENSSEAGGIEEVIAEPAKEPISEPISETETAQAREAIDYESLAREDLIRLKEEFPELSELSSIAELENPLRYASLRDLGLSPEEAYLATRKRERRQDNRAHLESSVPRFASAMPGSMPDAELRAAREIFSDISDEQIRNLYKRVTQ